MTRRNLLIGLVSAGAFTAGFGAAVFPATADLKTLTVTLAGGKTVTVKVDSSDTSTGPEVTQPTDAETTPETTSTAQEETQTSTSPADPPGKTSTSTTPEPEPEPTPSTPTPEPQAQPEQPAPPAAATPTTPQAGEDEDDAPPVVRQRQESQRTTGSRLHRDAEQAKPRVRPAPLRHRDGRPTIANPTYSEALPGPAPIGVPNFFIEKFRIPPFLLPIYQAAGIEYGIRWEILAAINEIETDYGRNLNVSSAGAVGWMQFMPATWKQYGVDANRDGKKDPYNPVDAIFAAARYLKAAGADQDIRKAIFAYNHADWYVDSVLMRARLIGGMPADLVGSLTGLTQGRFPVDSPATYADDLREEEYQRRVARGANAAVPVEGKPTRRGINIFTKEGAQAVATQDAKVIDIGENERLGKYIKIQDVYGNTYTYAHLAEVAEYYAVPKEREVSEEEIRDELDLPKDDPAPTQPASAGTQPEADEEAADPQPEPEEGAKPVEPRPDRPVIDDARLVKERAFANPARKRPYRHGGREQLLNSAVPGLSEEYKATFAKVIGLDAEDVDIRRMRVGAKVVAGTVLGKIGATRPDMAPHLHFEIRPAGRGAPRIDPKPILDGWKLLESTAIYRAAGKNPFFGPDAKHPTIGQILLMSKQALQRRVLSNPRIQIYECGERDIKAGLIDRRVLATLEFLAASGLRPTVSSLQCGHSYYTASGNVSHHSSGNAVDIAAINGIPILGNQGEGSITEMTIRRLLTLQGTMKPAQIISLMTFDGADNTIALPDHHDHIHIGFRPQFDAGTRAGRRVEAVLKPKQWIKLIERLGQIDNPKVLERPSKYAIDVDPRERHSVAHKGE